MSDNQTDSTIDDTTTKTKTRWIGTGSVVAGLLLMSLCAVVLLLIWRGEDVPLWASGTFSAAVLAATAWAFGAKALKSATSQRGKRK